VHSTHLEMGSFRTFICIMLTVYVLSPCFIPFTEVDELIVVNNLMNYYSLQSSTILNFSST